MAYSKDQLLLRNGVALSGKVLKNEFKIKTSFGDVPVKKESIAHVHFMRTDGSGFPASDEIITYSGDCIRGKLVQSQTISFVSSTDNQTERFHRSRIHSIILFDALDSYPADDPENIRTLL